VTVADHIIDRGGSPDGTLRVELFRFYGKDTVTINLVDGDTSANLTAQQARAVARDLVEHADRLDEQDGGDGTEASDYAPSIGAFVKTQLDHDRHYAYQASGLLGRVTPWLRWEKLKESLPGLSRADCMHIERQAPHRVLRQVEALRITVAAHLQDHECADGRWYARDEGCRTVRRIAGIYLDRPGYNEEWTLR
jgi:hypothetical protein